MITRDNLEDVLLSIGFQEIQGKNKQYTKTFGNDSITVDFEKENINYPSALTVNEHQTTNFSDKENFVVLECVCRLLDKGYHAKHIELEPRWQLGHGASGGRADILVRDENNIPLLIIECKTAGKQYQIEYKNTEADGGQLFSYWQQENAVRWLGLYASDWDGEKITYKSHVINCTDDQNVLLMAKKDKDILIYANAKNDNERFAVWDETYHKRWLDNVIFDDESGAYQIGIPPLRKGKLRDFTPDDKIVNRFEEILRHNNVSDKENAFNRLVALFICKLVDEITKQDFDEVDFQYKAGESYEDLQDRLQRLHQKGMEEFMKEEIFYVDNGYAERVFKDYVGLRSQAAINSLKETIRKLKFYSNNDFAFKDVHNEELFFQNGKILVEVVELFQPYRIVYPSKHQFLGDLFEQLLNKGFKQNEGQFFTPMPITRFIWDALPVQEYINRKGLPNVIDYACGAGHFLTEAVEAINAHRTDKDDNSWVEKHIFGIEKDYRLARVSKVSLFMNGAGDAKIIFGDGLENYPDKGIEENKFDILVANPPYSVSGFKQHLKLKNSEYRLFDIVGSDGKEIETFFVERIAKLVRSEGLAAVILPSSILSNSSNSYIAAREELLKHFHIRAIVSFGSKTFGATGTNTVTLFLERYIEPPCVAQVLATSFVEAALSIVNLGNFTYKEIREEYLAMQKIAVDDYLRFIERKLSWDELAEHAYFKMYVTEFSMRTINYPKKATEAEKEEIRTEKLYDYILKVEYDKLFYFYMVHNQYTIVITSPSDNKEQQQFLGYEWSNRKGNEGIVITKPGGKLYNEDCRSALGTVASVVRKSFIDGANTEFVMGDTENIQQYISHNRLQDMLDFSRSEFNKEIQLAKRKEIQLNSKYPIVKLGGLNGVCNILIGGTPARKQFSYYENGTNLWVSIAEMNGQIITDTKEKITDEAVKHSNVKLIPAGTTLLSFKLSIGKTAIAGKDLYTNEAIAGLIPKDNTQISNKYLFYLFNSQLIDLTTIGDKAFGKSLNSAYLNNEVQIPLPPMPIQEKIISECTLIDEEYNTSRMSIELYRNKIV